MNKLLFTLLIILTLSASTAEAKLTRLKHLKSYVEKGKKCDLAFAQEVGGQLADLTRAYSNPPNDPIPPNEPLYSMGVVCITDITSGKNTMGEASGCALSMLDSDTGKYAVTPYFPNPKALTHKEDLATWGTTCGNGGFEKLMELRTNIWRGNGVTPLNVSMSEYLATTLNENPKKDKELAENITNRVTFLYASDKKYECWYQKAIGRPDADVCKPGLLDKLKSLGK